MASSAPTVPSFWRRPAGRDLAAVGFLLAAALALFLVRMPDPTQMLVDGDDLVGDFYPSRIFSNGELLHGRVPLWNPHSFCGTPFLAEGQAGVFDPLHLLLLPLPVTLGLNVYALLHILGAGAAMFLYVRRFGASRTGALVAGAAFGLGGWPLGRLQGGHYPILPFQTFLPLALWGWETWRRAGRRSGLGVAVLCVAALAVAGHVQMLVYSAMFLAGMGLTTFVVQAWRGRARRGLWEAGGLAGACVVAGMLGAVQILPTLDFGRYCSRPQMSYEFCSMYSLGPESLLTLVAPRFFGGPHTGLPYWGRWNAWEMTTYAGLVPLLLAILAVVRIRSSRVTFYALVCVFSGALALGEHTPLLRLLHGAVPMFRMFRAWCRFAFFMQFALCVLAGLGADRLLRADNSPRGRLDRAVLMGLLAVVLAAVWPVVLYLLADGSGTPTHWMRIVDWRRSLGQPPDGAPWDVFSSLAPLRWHAVYALAATLVVAMAALALLPRWPRLLARPRLAQWALLLLVVPDVWSFALTRFDFVPTARARFAPEFVTAAQADAQAGRILKGAAGRPANQGMASGLDEVTGYSGVLTLRCNDFLTAALGIARSAQASWPPVDHITAALLKPNVAFVLQPRGRYCPVESTVSVTAGDQELRRVKNPVPRAYLASNIILCTTQSDALDEARWGHWLASDVVEAPGRDALAGVAQVSDHAPSSGSGRSGGYGRPGYGGGPGGHDGSGGYGSERPYGGYPGDASDASGPWGRSYAPPEPAPAAVPASQAESGVARILDSEPSRVVVAVQAAAPRLLVLNDSYDAHWRCTMTGTEGLGTGRAATAAASAEERQPLEILPVNLNFRGVVVPPGRHLVEFVYDPPSFRVGAWISVVTAFALAVVTAVSVVQWRRGQRRARKRAAAASAVAAWEASRRRAS